MLDFGEVFVDEGAGGAAADEVVVVGADDLVSAFAADAWDEVEPAVLFFEFAGVVVEAFLFSFGVSALDEFGVEAVGAVLEGSGAGGGDPVGEEFAAPLALDED